VIIKNISIKNFRNYDNLELDFSDRVNIFIGNNAQGKTNLLESIYVLAITRSHRMNIDNTLIKENEIYTKIKGEILKRNEKLKLEVLINEKGKCVKINNNIIRKISEYISKLTVIIFCPDDLEIVKGSPNVRRKFLNIEIGQLDNRYLSILNDYNKLLKTKNEYLKNIDINNKKDEYLDVLNEQLVDKAVKIYIARNEFLNNLEKYSKTIFKDIFGKGKFKIIYKPNIDLKTFEEKEIRSVLLEKLKSNIKRDIIQGTTTFGPHRDDFEFKLDENEIREYGSQGQQRLAVLCIKLAETHIFKEKSGEYPILLLDDVFSELDESKKNNIIKYLNKDMIIKYLNKDMQIFITTTEINVIDSKIIETAKIYLIKEGKIAE